MSTNSPSTLFPEFGGIPDLDQAYERRYPHMNVALAVASLRGQLGMTQGEFAERIGTTQSVIARLESGRHGVQVSLLNRIADAFDIDWRPLFELEGAATPAPAEATVAISGDPLLDAFNEANTSLDFDRAHRHARRIARDPSTPRRKLALALDAFNLGRFKVALRWSGAALGGDLPANSREVAALVAGRSLLAMRRPADALERLNEAGRSWLAGAARAEALMDASRTDEAVDATERLLATASGRERTELEYLAARVYWRANRALEAVAHVGAFRAQEPDDRPAILLHGAILGQIGDAQSDDAAYAAAMDLFERAYDENNADSVRLYAMTAARVRRWRDAIEKARVLADLADAGLAPRKSIDVATRIATETFERLDDPDEIERAVDLAAKLSLVDASVAGSRRAFARALRGDFEHAVAALGLEVNQLSEASPDDQVRCAAALVVKGRLKEAYPILVRNQDTLTVPEGQLLLAQAALAAANTTTARDALTRIGEADGAAADTARIALELVSAIEQSGRWDILAKVNWPSDDVRHLRVLPSAERAVPYTRAGIPVRAVWPEAA